MSRSASRRLFISRCLLFVSWSRYGLSVPRATLAVGAALASSSARAQDPVSIGLAAGAAIAGLIAAHNRSDGGLSAILTAMLAYQRVTNEQLFSLSEGLEKIERRVAQILPAMAKMFDEQTIKRFQSQVGTTHIQYINELKRANSNTFESFQAWRQDDLTQKVLDDVFKNVYRTVSEIESSGSLDPLTAVTLTIAVNVELSVRQVLNESPGRLAVVAQRYLDLFKQIAEDKTGTARGELTVHKKRYKEILAELAEVGFVAQPSFMPEKQWFPIYTVQVHDYYAGQAFKEICHSGGARQGFGDESCRTTQKYIAPRNGPTETFFYYSTVQESIMGSGIAGDDAFGIRQFALDGKPTLKKVSCDFADCSAKNVKLVVGDAANPADRLSLAQAQQEAAEKINSDLIGKFMELNLTIAKIAVCVTSLDAVEAARASLLAAFKGV